MGEHNREEPLIMAVTMITAITTQQIDHSHTHLRFENVTAAVAERDRDSTELEQLFRRIQGHLYVSIVHNARRLRRGGASGRTVGAK